MKEQNETLGQLSDDLQISVAGLSRIAWSLGIMADKAADTLEPEMADAIRAASPTALRRSTEAPAPVAAAPELTEPAPEPPEPDDAHAPAELLNSGPALRVFALADEYGVHTDVVLELTAKLGIPGANHLTLLSGDKLARVRTHFAMNPPKAFTEERLSNSLRKRRRLRPQK